MSEEQDLISVALINDYPVIVEGLRRMLEDHPRLTVEELSSGEGPERAVDVVLYDAFASSDHTRHDLARVLADPGRPRVVMYSWHVQAELVDGALAQGMHGFLAKELDAEELAEALVRVHEGEQVIQPRIPRDEIRMADWPGRETGLSPREAEVVALITQGVTNEEIARTCYLSINSVKSYIRSAYRKMGVERRSQAVLWGVENGMQQRAVHR